MCRILGVLVLMVMFVPRPSTALQLHWGSGATALSFAEATRCTLVVQADSSEQRLPSEWRLLWVADSSTDISPVPIEGQLACAAELAQVSAVDEPASAADSAAHLKTIHFCSDEGPIATVAQYLLDLPAESRGRFKAVALDPSDSTQVIESNEVTFNGGAWGEYPAVILHASSVHSSIFFRLTATGTGLARIRSLALVSPDSTWTVPLTIAQANDRTLSTVDSLSGLVPQCTVAASGIGGELTQTSLQADAEPLLVNPDACLGYFYGSQDTLTLQPRDFALVPGGYFDSSNNYAIHLYYIRDVRAHEFSTQMDFGHAVSVFGDLDHWIVLGRDVLHVPQVGWEKMHVWAPSIVRQGPIYRMLYAGVDSIWKQRIGLASSTNLNTWTRHGDPVFQVGDIPWADQTQPDLRDPFVMEDPDSVGQWLMFYVAADRTHSPQMFVGVAHSTGDLSVWRDWGQIQKTGGWLVGTNRIESPSVFRRNGKWWLVYTAGYSPGDTLTYITTGAGRPDDLNPDNWSSPRGLYSVVEEGALPDPLGYWKGSEYLGFPNAGNVEFFGAYDDLTEAIDFSRLGPASPPDSFALGCPYLTDAGPASGAAPPRRVDLVLTSALPTRDEVSLGVALPTAMEVHVAVYDLVGRRIRTLAHGSMPAGTTKLRWDGRTEGGAMAGSGVYFARLTCVQGRHVRRLVLMR